MCVCTIPQQGYFKVGNACPKCLKKCLSCSNYTGCDLCADIRITPPNCLCPDGTFDMFINEKCTKCSYMCAKCVDSANNCTLCA